MYIIKLSHSATKESSCFRHSANFILLFNVSTSAVCHTLRYQLIREAPSKFFQAHHYYEDQLMQNDAKKGSRSAGVWLVGSPEGQMERFGRPHLTSSPDLRLPAPAVIPHWRGDPSTVWSFWWPSPSFSTLMVPTRIEKKGLAHCAPGCVLHWTLSIENFTFWDVPSLPLLFHFITLLWLFQVVCLTGHVFPAIGLKLWPGQQPRRLLPPSPVITPIFLSPAPAVDLSL